MASRCPKIDFVGAIPVIRGKIIRLHWRLAKSKPKTPVNNRCLHPELKRK